MFHASYLLEATGKASASAADAGDGDDLSCSLSSRNMNEALDTVLLTVFAGLSFSLRLCFSAQTFITSRCVLFLFTIA